MFRSSLLVVVLCACGETVGEPSLNTGERPNTPTPADPQPDVVTKDPGTPAAVPSDLYSHAFGDAHARPVIFIHGAGSNSFPFEVGAAAALAARGNHVITYDQRGCGRSPTGTMADYSYARSVQDLDDLIHGLGLERPVLVGHGFGGTLALEYARAHPETARGVVLVSAPLDLPKTYFNAQLSCIARYESSASPQAAEDLQKLHARMYPNGLTAPFVYAPKDVLATVQTAQDCGLMNAGQQTTAGLVFWQAADAGALFNDHRWNVIEGYELNDRSSELDFFATLAATPVPVSALYGDQDPFVTMDQASKVAAAVGDAHFRWLGGAGQYPFLDDPNAFADTLAAELRALAP